MITDTAFYRYRHYHAPTDTPDKLAYPELTGVTSGLYAAFSELARGGVDIRRCHMWTPPFGKDFYERSCNTVGCSHMSGLSARLLWPLALMISAD